MGAQPTPESRTLNFQAATIMRLQIAFPKIYWGLKGDGIKNLFCQEAKIIHQVEKKKKKERDKNDMTCSLEYESIVQSLIRSVSTETHCDVRHMTDKFIRNTTLWKPKFHCKFESRI